MTDIGPIKREVTFEPLPTTAPVEEPAPPAVVPAEPEKVPA